jgi:lipoprotein NlpI
LTNGYSTDCDAFRKNVSGSWKQLREATVYFGSQGMVQASGGQSDASEFAANAEKLDRAAWPWPVVALFLGSASVDATRAAAGPEETCQAELYIGLYLQQIGTREEALRFLQSATDGCPKNSVEYGTAKSELERLR